MTATLEEFVPESAEHLADWMRQAAEAPAKALCPAGGRTALHYGYPVAPPATTVCLSRLTNVIDYPARDMTVTVEAGMRIEELSRMLSRENQRLAVDISESHRATLGGAVAVNTSGPRRFGLGTLRDYVIGVSAVDARGRLFKAGGRVVKNVAGYDLCKMLTGSLGTLAIITQLTLKLKPQPEHSGILWAGYDGPDALEQALQRLLHSGTRPVAAEVLGRRAAEEIVREAALDLPLQRFLLAVAVEGSHREVAWQLDTLQDELRSTGPASIRNVPEPQVAALWSALIDFAVPADEPLTYKANLLPSRTVEFLIQATERDAAVQAHALNGIVVGRLADDVTTAAAARAQLDPLRSLARSASGNLVILHCDDSWKAELPVFGDPVSGACLMQKLKTELDPRNVLNPGRLGIWRP